MMAKQQSSGTEESQESRILRELQASGFPHEITTGKRLERLGWKVSYNPIYFEQTNREYDLHANRFWSVRAGQFAYYTNMHFFVECKKSDKPWVFFLTEIPTLASGYQLVKAVAPEYPAAPPANTQLDLANLGTYLSSPAVAIPAAIHGGHHYHATGYWARTYHEPFKGKQEKGPQIYSAVMSITQAARHYYAAAIRAQQRQQATLNLYYPLIVFAGELYQAIVDDQSEIQLESTRHVRLLHASINPSEVNAQPWYQVEYWMVDVIHESYLDEFTSMVVAEGESISAQTHQMLADGKIIGYDMSASDKLSELLKGFTYPSQE
jgi:hypothetical protein